MPLPAHARRAALLVVLAAVLAGCGNRHPGERPASARFITAQQIERSGARDVWEVLKRHAPGLDMRETPSGEPTRLTSRGVSSIYLTAEPLVVLDGVRMVDFRSLRQIRAETVESIEIVSGADATRRYGTGGGNGAIVIKTRNPA